MSLAPQLQLDLGGAQDDDRGNTSEVIYSSSGDDDDFGDKESACEELENGKNQNAETAARPEHFFLGFIATLAEVWSLLSLLN